MLLEELKRDTPEFGGFSLGSSTSAVCVCMCVCVQLCVSNSVCPKCCLYFARWFVFYDIAFTFVISNLANPE